MDIEGGEVPWIQSLQEEDLDRCEQIVMEFHFPFSTEEIEVFDKLNKHHYLVHFHGNNFVGVTSHHNVVIPNVFECTYLHKKYFPSHPPPRNTDTIPGVLDMRNDKSQEDICIHYPPFVHPPETL
jgi:hypothetical protein